MIIEKSQSIVGINTEIGVCEICDIVFPLDQLRDPFPGGKTVDGKPSPESLVCPDCLHEHLDDLAAELAAVSS